ncbi:Cas10/Cmr2 second palm domain-containing protein [Hoylesella shahii]|uniref:Cas10/Cmr2 second palm domain-containing protein n=1 Tax=Hoylesella shahii DSM 15611 = JCM 12083 TaxID=1122991 RepID=A0A318HUA7_9BACT|nr:hypothetical protein [Hoylesella shahii]PXX16634.1 hypothetical protein EJ73_02740 [Hoylesella shahii DSM 15611 = JCM 12083]
MGKYLYGASVQGIQSFIFQTNQLNDISGASELVENICTKKFKETVGNGFNEKSNAVIMAAGNVKYVFDTREQCQHVVRNFPRMVQECAPGITFSQAVVKFDDEKHFEKAVEELEKKLKTQRNLHQTPLEVGMLGCKRAPKTGMPVVKIWNGEELDAATYAKRVARKDCGNRLYIKSMVGETNMGENDFKFKEELNIKDLTEKNDWIAIVHIDGNGLGTVVQKLGKEREKFREFSYQLDQATTKAANKAFETIKAQENFSLDKLPFSPVVLGGDDLTVIIRGDLAMPYAQKFITEFERETSQGEMKSLLSKANMNKLTACGGIAYIKASFPFYYGYKLAEELCLAAKTDAKAKDKLNVPSCLMFHKMQDSFVLSYKDIKERELELKPKDNSKDKAANNGQNTPATPKKTLCFGPYYLDEQVGYKTINDLERMVKELGKAENEGLKTGVRQWLSLMHENEEAAAQRLQRLESLTSNKKLLLNLTTPATRTHVNNAGKEEQEEHYAAYDVLAYYTINNQQTND